MELKYTNIFFYIITYIYNVPKTIITLESLMVIFIYQTFNNASCNLGTKYDFLNVSGVSVNSFQSIKNLLRLSL